LDEFVYIHIVQKQKICPHSRTHKSNLNYSKCMNFAALMTLFLNIWQK